MRHADDKIPNMEETNARDDFTAHLGRDKNDTCRAVGGAAISETDNNTSPVFSHLPVMLHECIDALAVKDGGTYVDGTAGGGGHSYEIASRMGSGRLISIDRDSDAIAACEKRLSGIGNVTLVHDNYRNLASILDSLDIENGAVDGIMFDLGVSSYQIDTVERGFSYSSKEDAPLDMRMSREDRLSAYDIVNTYTESELYRIISEFGEERFASRIAKAIVNAREASPIMTTRQLSELVRSAVPAATVERGSHPAKRTFQAIRIEVNGELDGIEPSLRAAVDALRPGGRLAVITFHSLEDRIVKTLFAELSRGCTCPPDFPVCVCGNKPKIKLVNRKPTTASGSEIKINPRSKSAKLRIAEKL